MARLGFAGLGAMGRRMARRLLEAGHEVVVWNRTPSAAAELREAGASVAASPAALAGDVEAVVTMVASPEALRAVTEEPDGIAVGIGPGTTLIDMSTVGPAAVRRLGGALPDGTPLLDAPVLGSLAEVEAGTLRIFVGGDASAYAQWEPLLQVLGSPLHVGPSGAGAAAKLVANSTLVDLIGVLGEALALAAGLGLDEDTAFSVLAATALAGQAERRRPSVEARDYPPRFRLALARKDAGLVLAAAHDAGLDLRLAAAAESWLADAERAGLGDLDYTAVLEVMLGRGA